VLPLTSGTGGAGTAPQEERFAELLRARRIGDHEPAAAEKRLSASFDGDGDRDAPLLSLTMPNE
jgi:hypothetical protein